MQCNEESLRTGQDAELTKFFPPLYRRDDYLPLIQATNPFCVFIAVTCPNVLCQMERPSVLGKLDLLYLSQVEGTHEMTKEGWNEQLVWRGFGSQDQELKFAICIP